MNEQRTAGLILAAGNASRFGGLKQLVSVDGEPLLVHVIRVALASSLDKVFVVLGFEAERISGHLGEVLAHPKLSVLTNTLWRQGMATSLRTGMAQIEGLFDSVMVILGDLPFLTPRIIDRVLEAHRTSDRGICLPVHEDGRWGHPICLSSRYFENVMELDGDVGARGIIKSNWTDVYKFPVQEEGCFFDVDTKEEMRFLTKEDRGQSFRNKTPGAEGS